LFVSSPEKQLQAERAGSHQGRLAHTETPWRISGSPNNDKKRKQGNSPQLNTWCNFIQRMLNTTDRLSVFTKHMTKCLAAHCGINRQGQMESKQFQVIMQMWKRLITF